jgi:hypothetical protein
MSKDHNRATEPTPTQTEQILLRKSIETRFTVKESKQLKSTLV